MINNYVTDSLEIGTKLNNYVIQSVLGRGAFGITYLAFDEDLEHLVAIKEYLPQELAMRDADNTVHSFAGEKGELFCYGLESFLREARTIVKFRHPNIVSVLTLFRKNDTAYMVMEYEKGKTLKSYVKGRKNIPQHRLLSIFSPINDGLLSVHHRGYIHRDIKPDNIVIREDNTPVLIDFGTARDTLNSNSDDLTQIFTNGYAPFEQCHPTWAKQGPWTDIYSLGATLYYAITGERIVAAQLRMLNDPYEPLVTSRHNGFYSPNFLQAIDDALSFQPKERPQSLEDWNYALNLEDTEQDRHQVETAIPPLPNKHTDQKTVNILDDVPSDLELAMSRAVTIDAQNINATNTLLIKEKEKSSKDETIEENSKTKDEITVSTKALNLKLAFTIFFLIMALLVPVIYYIYSSSNDEGNIADVTDNDKDHSASEADSKVKTSTSLTANTEKNIKKELPEAVKDLIQSTESTLAKTNLSFSQAVTLCNTLNREMNSVFYQELRTTYLHTLQKSLTFIPKTDLKQIHKDWIAVQENNIRKNKAGFYEVTAEFKQELLTKNTLYGSLKIESPSIPLVIKIAGGDTKCSAPQSCKTPMKDDKIRAGEIFINFSNQQKKINRDDTLDIHPNQDFILYLK